MGAGAPYGNRNAEKWTFKKAIKLYDDAIKLSLEQESSYLKIGEKAVEVTGYKYDFIGEVARALGTFKEIFSHLEKRFPILNRKHNELITNIEANCYYNGKKGNIKEASAIMNLKSNHKWTDRIDNTSKDEHINNNDLSREMIEKIVEKL